MPVQRETTISGEEAERQTSLFLFFLGWVVRSQSSTSSMVAACQFVMKIII